MHAARSPHRTTASSALREVASRNPIYATTHKHGHLHPLQSRRDSAATSWPKRSGSSHSARRQHALAHTARLFSRWRTLPNPGPIAVRPNAEIRSRCYRKSPERTRSSSKASLDRIHRLSLHCRSESRLERVRARDHLHQHHATHHQPFLPIRPTLVDQVRLPKARHLPAVSAMVSRKGPAYAAGGVSV